MHFHPLPEIKLYFVAHFLFISYCIFVIYKHRSDIYQENPDYGFDDGWAVLGSHVKRDSSDYEWTSWKLFLTKSWPFYLVHVILSGAVRVFLSDKLIPVAAVSITICFIQIRYGCFMLLLLTGTNLLYYGVSSFKSRTLIWLLAGVQLVAINLLKTDYYLGIFQEWTELEDEETVEVVIILAWCILKCMSFSLENIDPFSVKQRFALINFFHYVFYFPTTFLGPVMVYSRFGQISSGRMSLSKLWYKITKLVLDLNICLLWSLVLELALHYLYVNSLQNSVETVNKLDTWALFGYGYLMGQYFHLKYVVGYGIGIAIANFDDHRPPRKPICVARIHRYSDMWKYFDEGLYEFLFRYIYCALSPKSGSSLRKILAMCVTFLFVYLWHGYFLFVFVWVLMNLICLLLETYWKKLKANATYRIWVSGCLSENNQRRLDAVIGTQILILAVISNFFFLANEAIGTVFLKRAYLNGVSHYVIHSLSLVFIYFTSEHIRTKELLQSDHHRKIR